jgi:hypothetical protein
VNLSENQFAVGKAKFETGTVLNNDGTIHRSGNDEIEIYEIFNNYNFAKEFAILKVSNNPEIECWIENAKRETVFYIDKNGERKVK